MPKDSRYKVVKVLIESGEIKSFDQIFEFIAKRVVYDDLGVNYAKFQRIFLNPALLTLRELMILADLIECDPHKLFDLAISKRAAAKKAAKKPKG